MANELRAKFLNYELSENENNIALKQNFPALGLEGDEFRDWVDGFDWSVILNSELPNTVFALMDLDDVIENFDYYGVSVINSLVITNCLAKTHLLYLANFLVYITQKLDVYEDYFLDTLYDDSGDDWVKLFDSILSRLEDVEQSVNLTEAKQKFVRFLLDNF